jgi:hypothetical protein
MIRDTHYIVTVRVLSLRLSVSFVNLSVRMLRAVRMTRDTHPNCESVECELSKP